MNELLTTLLVPAGIVAALVVATTEALRARVPALDGWAVLLSALGLALVWTALLHPLATLPDALDAGRIAAVAWLLAVGGDSWAAKLAGKSATIRTVIAPSPPTHVTLTRDTDRSPPPGAAA